jgi:TonB family protein
VAAAGQELAQQEAERQAAARAEAERLAAERRESERLAAARQELAQQEAERQAATERQENARQAAAGQEQARQEEARLEAAREQDARRDAARRAMGRQLDEEAARRAAEQEARERSPSASSFRRGRLFGRTDPNVELVLYAEAWSRKIQFNTAYDMVRDVAKRPHTDAIVTVAIRSDGSIESVAIVRSSGVAAIDDAIRRIVHAQTPNLPFQPALIRDFDVIEIRRTWHFDSAIRLY